MINYLILHLLFIVYALNTVLGRMAAPYGWTDWRRFALLAGVLFLLGIYAAGWQVMLKKFNLGVAYANRAAVVIWGILKRELPSCPCSGPTTAFRNRTRARNMCHLTKSALSGNPSNNRQFSVFLSPCPQETLWAFCLPVHKRYPTLPLQPCSLFDSIPSTSRASGADKV